MKASGGQWLTCNGDVQVIESKSWGDVGLDLMVDPLRTDAGFRLRVHYKKYLHPYEIAHFTPPEGVATLSKRRIPRTGSVKRDSQVEKGLGREVNRFCLLSAGFAVLLLKIALFATLNHFRSILPS